MSDEMLLAGDIGGTKTDLALFNADAGPRAPQSPREFPSGRYASLTAIAREYLASIRQPVTSACFAVAGPVLNGRAETTNLPWHLDEADLAHELGLTSVHLLNDLEAFARAVPLLRLDDAKDLVSLNDGQAQAAGAIGVIAPGTGLGEAFLTWDGSRYRAHPSEGGHADFAPTDERQAGLLAYLRAQHGHVSWERVCSGIAVPSLYDYLRGTGVPPESPAFAGELAAAPDPTHLIFDAGLHRMPTDALCAATVELFVELLGAEAGNLALKLLATGGVYLGGGIPTHILPALQTDAFLHAFSAKGRFHDLLSRIPVRVIMCQAALIGAASCGLELMPA